MSHTKLRMLFFSVRSAINCHATQSKQTNKWSGRMKMRDALWWHFDGSDGRANGNRFDRCRALYLLQSLWARSTTNNNWRERRNSDGDVFQFLKNFCCATKGYQVRVEKKLSLCGVMHTHIHIHIAVTIFKWIALGVCVWEVVDQMNNNNTLTSSVAHKD